MGKVILHPKSVLPVRKGHPWVFRESIRRIEGQPTPGSIVSVFDEQQNWIANGWFSPFSQIQVRLLSWDRNEPLENGQFLETRIRQAIDLRRVRLQLDKQTNSFRVIHSEGDRLPGLIADWFDGVLVVGISTWGMYLYQEKIEQILQNYLAPKQIFFFHDAFLKKEGLDVLPPVFPERDVDILEHNCSYRTRIGFQKTGFYLDQRDNRQLFRQFAFGEVLDAFCFAGGFGVQALKGQAEKVLFLDSSSQALEQTKINLELNQVSGECLRADVHHQFNLWKAEGRRFDTICLDPPKFVSQKSHLKQGLKKYQAINQLALSLLRPEGVLATFSCSGAVDEHLFLRMLSDAASSIKRDIQVLMRLQQAPDHPFLPSCPQSVYLKGFLLRVIS